MKRTHILDYKNEKAKELGWEVEIVANFKYGDYNQYKLTRHFKNGNVRTKEVLVNKYTNEIECKA